MCGGLFPALCLFGPGRYFVRAESHNLVFFISLKFNFPFLALFAPKIQRQSKILNKKIVPVNNIQD